MGKIISRIVRREVTRFNVESRTDRVLEQEKPTPAPKYESNLRDMERALEVDPQLLEKLNKKNTELDERLKQVYVTSHDSPMEPAALRKEDPNRPLPLDRKTPTDFEYGYMEPKRISAGHCTLRQALEFITANQSEPELWTQTRIATDYKLKESLVANILQHFKTFSVHIPDEKFKDKQLSITPRKQLTSTEEKEG